MIALSIVAFYNSVVSVVYDETIFHAELNISAANVVNNKTIFQVILIVSAVGEVNDEIIFYGNLGNHCSRRSQLLPFLNARSWKCISHVFLKIHVVSVVSGKFIFYVVFKISVVSVVTGEIMYSIKLFSCNL